MDSRADLMHALRICRPYLSARPQTILNIGTDPSPWLTTIEQFFPGRHQLAGCVHGATHSATSSGFPLTPAELDPWSPLAVEGLPASLPGTGNSLITAFGLIDRLYHPEPFFKAASQALSAGGVLVLAAENISSRDNLLRLLEGNGLMGSPSDFEKPYSLSPVCGGEGRGEGPSPEMKSAASCAPSQPPALTLTAEYRGEGTKGAARENLRQAEEVEETGCIRPRVRLYAWREIALMAMRQNFLPTEHGFYNARVYAGAPLRSRSLDDAVRFLIPEKRQKKSHWYLVLRKTLRIPRARFAAYMLRHAPRAVVRYARDQIKSSRFAK